MTVLELQRRLRMFPPDAVVGFEEANFRGGHSKALREIEGAVLKPARRTGSESMPEYILSPGTAKAVVLR